MYLNFFRNHLPPEKQKTIEGKVTAWRALEGNASPQQKMKYGWSIYAVGQKRAA